MTSPLTKEAFAAWCDTKPADETYNWGDIANCACGQYADAIDDHGAGGDFWHDAQRIALGDSSADWTFGKFAARLRADEFEEVLNDIAAANDAATDDVFNTWSEADPA